MAPTTQRQWLRARDLGDVVEGEVEGVTGGFWDAL
jgi:hypothetical protein